jgi:hypothetical protein
MIASLNGDFERKPAGDHILWIADLVSPRPINGL